MLVNGGIHSAKSMSYQSSNDSTKIEDRPESENVTAFGLLRRITHHDLALGAPENSSAAAKKKAGENDIAFILSVIVAQV